MRDTGFLNLKVMPELSCPPKKDFRAPGIAGCGGTSVTLSEYLKKNR